MLYVDFIMYVLTILSCDILFSRSAHVQACLYFDWPMHGVHFRLRTCSWFLIGAHLTARLARYNNQSWILNIPADNETSTVPSLS